MHSRTLCCIVGILTINLSIHTNSDQKKIAAFFLVLAYLCKKTPTVQGSPTQLLAFQIQRIFFCVCFCTQRVLHCFPPSEWLESGCNRHNARRGSGWVLPFLQPPWFRLVSGTWMSTLFSKWLPGLACLHKFAKLGCNLAKLRLASLYPCQCLWSV